MSVVVQRAEFAADRQFVDVVVGLPDRRPGWAVALHAQGPDPVSTTRQSCLAHGGGAAAVRFYPFAHPGSYTLMARLIAPDADDSPRQKRAAREMVEIGKASVPPLDEAAAATWLRQDGADLQQAASRALVPLCVDPHGTPCFWPLRGETDRRIAVLSIPKAGTYLMTNLLTNLGVVSCNVHLGRGLVSDYRLSKQMPAPTPRYLDVAISARLVLPGQSMASHMVRDLATQVSLHGYNKIFVYRELRAALVSAFRTGARRSTRRSAEKRAAAAAAGRDLVDSAQGFVAWLERDIERMRRQYVAAAGWHGHPGVCLVSFEEIMGDAGPDRQVRAVVAVAAQCGVSASDEAARALLGRTIGAETQTFSGARSTLDEYWSPAAEALFRKAGLRDLNVRFGYEPA